MLSSTKIEFRKSLRDWVKAGQEQGRGQRFYGESGKGTGTRNFK